MFAGRGDACTAVKSRKAVFGQSFSATGIGEEKAKQSMAGDDPEASPASSRRSSARAPTTRIAIVTNAMAISNKAIRSIRRLDLWALLRISALRSGSHQPTGASLIQKNQLTQMLNGWVKFGSSWKKTTSVDM